MNHLENRHVEPPEKQLDRAAPTTARTDILAISGMDCSHCIARVRDRLLSQRGVLLAYVYLVSGVAVVTYDPNRVTVSSLVGAVVAASLDGRHDYQARFLATKSTSAGFKSIS
jgi:copper chaperone CopZ